MNSLAMSSKKEDFVLNILWSVLVQLSNLLMKLLPHGTLLFQLWILRQRLLCGIESLE